MTFSFTFLLDYLITSFTCVNLVNGSQTSFANSRNAHLIDLLAVLHLPDFPFNLLSISKIVTTLQSSVTFYPSLYVFQDLKIQNDDWYGV